MKDHLLSIFPLQGMDAYARVSCLVLESDSTDCSGPFTVTRGELVALLATAFSVAEAAPMITTLDQDRAVQLPISTEQARQLGFVPKVN